MTAIEPILSKRWRCTVCRKSWSKASRAASHVCHKDPETRACRTCLHNITEEPEVGVPSGCDKGVRGDNHPHRAHCDEWNEDVHVMFMRLKEKVSGSSGN